MTTTSKLPNPFMHGVVFTNVLPERIAEVRKLNIEINKVLDVGDAKARLWYAQTSLRAYRVMLGGAEQAIKIGDLRYPPQPAYMTTLRNHVARHEQRLCEALDRLWLAQENAA